MSANKNKLLFFLLFMLIALPATIGHSEQKTDQAKVVWTKDDMHARLGFSVKHMTISYIEGHFKDFSAVMVSAAPDFSDAVIEVKADVASIDTELEARDKHLIGPDFFDAAKYPAITFKSTSVKPMGDNFAKIFGYLTIHGVSKLVELDAVFSAIIPNQMTKTRSLGMRLVGTVNRSDFKLAPTFPDDNIGNLVQINVNMEFISDK